MKRVALLCAALVVLLVGCNSPIPDCEDGWSGVWKVDGAVLDATGGIDVDGAHYDSCLRFCEHVNPDRGPVVSCSFEDRPEGESSAGDYTGRIACVHDGVTCERSTIVEGPGWNL